MDWQKNTGYSNSNCLWIIKKITQTYTSVISEFHWKWWPLILLSEICGRPLLWIEFSTLAPNRTNCINGIINAKTPCQETKTKLLSNFPRIRRVRSTNSWTNKSVSPAWEGKQLCLNPSQESHLMSYSSHCCVSCCLLCPAQSIL